MGDVRSPTPIAPARRDVMDVVAASQAIQALLSKGALSYDDVLSGDLKLASDLSRHQATIVLRENGPSYFMKTVRPDQPAAMETLLHEARFYDLIRSDASLANLRAITPNLVCYDERLTFLVTEFIKGGVNLSTYHRSINEFPPDIGRELGALLGRWRAATPATLRQLQPHTPWILSFASAAPSPTLSGAQHQLHALVAASGARPVMESVRARYGPSGIVHGDLKWENCVISHRDGKPLLRIIDWEIVGLGDPMWDVASMLASYIAAWAFSVPADAGVPAPEKSPYPLAVVKPAMRALWTSYLAAIDLPHASHREYLERCLTYTAARLLQTIFEYNIQQQILPTPSIMALQLAVNLLQEPLKGVNIIDG